MNHMHKKIWLAVIAIFITVAAVAQSAADLELAKQLARQQGYSESQIEAMLKQKQGGATTGTNQQTKTVDRNAAVKEQQYNNQQNQQNQQYNQQNQGMNTQGMQLQSMQGIQGMQNMPGMQNGQFTGAGEMKMIDLPGFNGRSMIFGHDIFKSTKLNFIPNYNIPTPDNYRLSPGDEVVIDIWGNVITNITTTISPEGSIVIPDLGPVYLAGQTVSKAEKSLKDYLSKIYSGISDPTPSTFVKLALGKIGSITVNVVGDVVTPGSYTLPSFSTMASAMYLAGGPTDIGTIREIKLYRHNKLISTFDIYDFITKGIYNTNIRLEDNDVISVGPYSGIVTVMGGIKRPMKYEVKKEETLDKVLNYAGGFSDAAYSKSVHIDRVNSSGDKKGATAQSFDVEESEYATFKVADGDIIRVLSNDNRFRNQVKIAGAVWRPGTYAMREDVNQEKGEIVAKGSVSTLKQLIEAAGGLKEDAFLQKGYIVRYGENRTKEQVSFSLQNIILGSENILLAPDDSVQVFSVDSIAPKQTVSIYGEVNRPSGKTFDGGDAAKQELVQEVEYKYRKGMTIGDLILQAKGVTDAATLGKVEIARRITKYDDGRTIDKKDTIAVIMHYNILKNPKDINVKLEPFDIVFIRRSSYYKPQQAIAIEGEVNYPGTYVIEKNTVRLSDVVSKAMGFNSDAYVLGAKLTRTITKEEKARMMTAMQLSKKQSTDSTTFDNMEIKDQYDIAINLEEAVANPGSYADVVLRENDKITVPKLNNTVKVSGAVLYPNTVGYNPKYSWKTYLSNAGGALQRAKVSKAYMVHMNGSVATKGSKGFEVRPGTEIVIPMKDKKDGGQSFAAIISVASSTASLAAMVVTILNQTK